MKHNWENYFDISSEYWKKVEKIYEDSESFPKKVVKDRNLHHKFPRSFSKKDGIDIDNDADNLVSLSLADHFRVHYYLWKCAKKGYRGMMALAFTLMRKKVVVYASEETIEQLAKDYENAMKEAAEQHSKEMKGHPVSDETRRKISESSKGKQKSEEARRKMAESQKGKHAGEKNPMYGKLHTKETRKKMSCSWDYDKHFTADTRKKMAGSAKGKKLSEEHKKKLSEAKKGMRWFNNGKINIRAKECPDGFVPGRLLIYKETNKIKEE